MTRRRICDRDELVSGEMIPVSSRGRRILLVDVGGRLCAYLDRCEHKGVPLSEGSLRGTTLTCTAHHWTYDVATGRGINPDSAALVSVPCEVVGGAVWMDDGAGDDAAAPTRGLATAPLAPAAASVAAVRQASRMTVARVPDRNAEPSLVGPRASTSSTSGRVGPVLLAGVVTDAVIDAIRESHANAMIVDQGSYLRVLVPDRCVIRAEDVRKKLHAPFSIPADLEPLMCSFKGVFTASEEEAVFESKRRS